MPLEQVCTLQAYYLAAPFAVERAPTKALYGYTRRKDVEVALLSDYPIRGLVFEAGESFTAMANLVGAACKRLQARSSLFCPPPLPPSNFSSTASLKGADCKHPFPHIHLE